MTGSRPGLMAPRRARVSAFVSVPDAIAVVDTARLRPPLRCTDGRLCKAGIAIGDSAILLGDAAGNMAGPGIRHVCVPAAQATSDNAVAAAATPVGEPERRAYGGGAADVTGDLWWTTNHVENVTSEEMRCRTRMQEEQ